MERRNNMGERRFTFARIAFWILTGLAAALFFSAIFAVAVTFLWNWLMPGIFGVKQIDYLQALGLIVLTRLLVGGWHRDHGSGHPRFHGMPRERYFPGHEEFHDKRHDFNGFWNKQGRELFMKYMESKEEEKTK